MEIPQNVAVVLSENFCFRADGLGRRLFPWLRDCDLGGLHFDVVQNHRGQNHAGNAQEFFAQDQSKQG